MSFKNLLAYVDGSARCETVVDCAARLAAAHKAQLSGLHVVGFVLPAPTGSEFGLYAGPLHPGRMVSLIRDAAVAAAQRAQTVFEERSRGAGVTGDWRLAEGMVAYTAGLWARNFDMTIVGQVDPDHPPLGTRKFVPEALFLDSGRPVLVIPFAGTFPTIGENVLIAWDGGREAARAVNDAMPLLERARSVTVATIGSGTPLFARDTPDPAAIVSHLARHGIQATATAPKGAATSVAETLLGHAADIRADLLVMGGYGHSRMREVVLGGTTQGILRHAKLPVLMSH